MGQCKVTPDAERISVQRYLPDEQGKGGALDLRCPENASGEDVDVCQALVGAFRAVHEPPALGAKRQVVLTMAAASQTASLRAMTESAAALRVPLVVLALDSKAAAAAQESGRGFVWMCKPNSQSKPSPSPLLRRLQCRTAFSR